MTIWNVLLPIGTLLLGSAITFLLQCWALKQSRKDEDARFKRSLTIKLLEKRLSAYSEGLEFVLQIESKQGDAKNLEVFFTEFSKWFTSKCGYLSPRTVDLFSKLFWEIRKFSILLEREALKPDDRDQLKAHIKDLEKWLKEKKELMDIPESME